MKLIGKIEGSLVYEMGRGRYVIVSCEEDGRERWEVTPVWSSPLGRFAWTFTKCSSDPREARCLEILKRDKDAINKELEKLNRLWAKDETEESLGPVLDELEEKLDSMEDGEVWDWDDE